MTARLILGGRPNLKVISSSEDSDGLWISVVVGTKDGIPVTTFKVGRGTGMIEGLPK
jgi:hypothetical protein